jgi:hypothetical protein
MGELDQTKAQEWMNGRSVCVGCLVSARRITIDDYGAGVGDMSPVLQALLPPPLCFHTVDRARVLFRLRSSQSQRRRSRITIVSKGQGIGQLSSNDKCEG